MTPKDVHPIRPPRDAYPEEVRGFLAKTTAHTAKGHDPVTVTPPEGFVSAHLWALEFSDDAAIVYAVWVKPR